MSRAPDPGHSSLPETGPGDADPQVRPHASPLVRGLLIVTGSLCVALGLVGMFLPLLPTTPFLLLAAACYARASRRFYEALLASRTFGPVILEWRRHRSVPYRTKLSAIALMSLTLGISIVFFVPLLWAQVLLALFGLGMAIWMYRLPSRDRPRR
ncbi:MAG: YbaN family protein [Betaproteobacteria bacterium]